MESPENVWQFSRPSNDPQASTSFLVPTQYEDFCGQSNDYQVHGRPDTLQSAGTLTSSAHDGESQLVIGSTLIPSAVGCTNEFGNVQATDSFSSVATLRDQSMQLQPVSVNSRATPTTVSTPQSTQEIEQQVLADSRSIRNGESLNDSARNLSGHALPGLVSFEPVVAYIDPRSQTLPYNNSAAPTYQNSFYYSCMPPPLLYPPQFSTFYNHQPIALASKTDPYHVQPMPLHQQESRSKLRQFWTEEDARRSRFAAGRSPENSLMEVCEDLAHKTHRNEALDFGTYGKHCADQSALISKSDVARKRHRTNQSNTRAQCDVKAKLPLTGTGPAGTNRASTRGRKMTFASPTPIRIAKNSGPVEQVAFLNEDTYEAIMPLAQNTSPVIHTKQISKENLSRSGMIKSGLELSPYHEVEHSNEQPIRSDIDRGIIEQSGNQFDGRQLSSLYQFDTLMSAAQLAGSSHGIIKREDDDGEVLKVEEACLQGQSESMLSSMTTGAVGVIEWQKNCHQNEKEYRTKLVVHDSTNRRDCSPRRSRRVSYNYSESDLSPVPSVSIENDSEDRDDVELKVNEAASTKWSDGDNARLVRLRASGTTWPALATALGRSKRACQLKYVQLTKQAPYFFLGHPNKLDHLLQLYEERKDSFWNDIALELGCLPRVAEEKIFELSREKL